MDLVNHLEGRLLFAVPKKGRLLQAALNLLEGADIQFKRENRLDIALVKNLPIALVFLPAADIPTFVGEGRVSLGITGRDQVAEHDAGVEAARRERADSGKCTPAEGDGISMSESGISTPGTTVSENGMSTPAEDGTTTTEQSGVIEVMDLDFGSCKLQVQVPEKGVYKDPPDLIGKNIGTSFVHLAEDYFAALEKKAAGTKGEVSGKRKLKTKIIELSGSVEAACALGVADGIVDLVESGETMKAAGLKAIDTVVSSTAVLVQSKNPSNPAMVELIASRIRGVITAQKYILCQYNIPRHRLAAAIRITPGRRAPTINALEEEGWLAVSSMVEKKRVAVVMDELCGVGATDILVLEIANTRVRDLGGGGESRVRGR